MNVLFVVSECVPFIKTGGLADVAGSLPKALNQIGQDVRVILPLYKGIPSSFRAKMEKVLDFTVTVGWREQQAQLFCLNHNEVQYYFVDMPYYFERKDLYGYMDDGERFAFFSLAVLEVLSLLDFDVNAVHCHDWHTGMIPYLLKNHPKYHEKHRHIRSLFTIHNLQFQGVFPEACAWDFFGLGQEHLTDEALKYYDCINYMKAAIVGADLITTVSPTYKEEIQYEYFGENLDGLLRKYSYKLKGILNGIDYEVYNPSRDSALTYPFDEHTIVLKSTNKKALQKELKLPVRSDLPMIVMISRLTKQKGLDLLKHILHELLQKDVQLVILGTGDFTYESYFEYMEANFKNKMRAIIGFDEALAHRIYGSADLYLMPSLFEPCGLSQMIALRYGAIPIVREIGGLNDTIHPYSDLTPDGNGFTFHDYNAHDLYDSIERALRAYGSGENWGELIRNAMRSDYSWRVSANEYKKLYSLPIHELMG